MADNFRYRYGETDPILIALKSGVAVGVGDLAYQDSSDSNTLKPASSKTWVVALAAPAAPTAVTSGVAIGTAFTTATWNVKATFRVYRNGVLAGETAPSAAAAVSMTASHAMKVTAVAMPALPEGATDIRIAYYVEDAAGSGNFWYVLENDGAGVLITGIGGGANAVQPPASTQLTATAMTQLAFSNSFAGVSAQSFDGTNTTAYGIKDGKLRVDTRGFFDYPTASATFAVGDLVGPAKDTGNNLLAQQLVAVAASPLAVGRVVVGGTSVTSIRVKLFGRKADIFTA